MKAIKGIIEIRKNVIKESDELDYTKRDENSVSFLAHGTFNNQKWTGGFTLDKIQFDKIKDFYHFQEVMEEKHDKMISDIEKLFKGVEELK